MVDQQLDEQDSRVMSLAVSVDPSVVSPLLPAPVPNEVLSWNNDGTALTSSTIDTSSIAVPGEGRTTPTATAFLQRNAEYNIRDYSAVADNTTNNLAFIQNAINAAGATRGIVRIPYAASLYKVTGILTLPSNVAIVFDKGARINAQCTDQLFYATGATEIVIDGADISGVMVTALYVNSGSKIEVVNSMISGASVHSGSLGTCAGVLLRDCTKSTIDRCEFFGNGDGVLEAAHDIGIIGGASYGNQDNQITNNICRSTTVDVNLALFCNARAIVTGNRVSGAMVMASSAGARGGDGIILYNGSSIAPFEQSYDCTVSNNVVQDVEGVGIYLQRYKNSVVSANVVHDTCSVLLDATLSASAIVDDGGNGNIISANTVYNCFKHGITVVGGGGPQSINLNSVVSSNLIDNLTGGTSFQGIGIRGTCTDALITGNNILNSTGVAIGEWSDGGSSRIRVIGNTGNILSTYGIWARASSSGWSIIGNQFSTMTDPASLVVNQGTNNVVWGNRANNDMVFNVPLLPSALQLSGVGSDGTQIKFGTSGTYGSLGNRVSGGDAYMATNAYQTAPPTDSWTQTDAANASGLCIIQLNGDMDFFIAAAGTAVGNFATFWGTAKTSLSRTGGVKVNGTAVLGAKVTGWTAQTAVPARVDLGAAPTVNQLASAFSALMNDLTNAHHLLGP